MTTEIRKPAVAGTFYPASSSELLRTIATMFSEVEKVAIEGRPLGLIAPHAGYPYSGKTAAKAFKLLEGEDYDTVVIISPSHTVFFRGCSVYSGAGYQTPIAIVETDRPLSDRIAGINPQVYSSTQGHAVGSSRGEHALEVQLPFLQVALGNFKLVAIVMGDQEEDTIKALGECLASALKGTNSLIVASTDLSHFHSAKQARKLDASIQAAIEAYDPDQLIETLQEGRGEACGGGPVAAMMLAAQRLGAKKTKFLEYTNSGEVTGDFDEVVGYLSAVVSTELKPEPVTPAITPATKGAPAALEVRFALSHEDREFLLRIAREAISARLEDKKYTPPSSEGTRHEAGVFVTLKHDGELRGCIGQVRARQPLNQAVADMAQAAAFEDPRFDPVTADELDELEYELSVLSRLTRVKDFSRLKIGRDGLMIKLDMHTGLLLPQVAIENKWDVVEFLEQTCLKAGIHRRGYKDRYAEVYRFSAEVF